MELKTEHDGPILRWTVSRPNRRNALGDQLAKELESALDLFEGQWRKWVRTSHRGKAPAHVLVIDAQAKTGTAPIWIAGGDLNEHASKTAKQGKSYSNRYIKICRRIEELPVPVLMKINGAVIGGGVEFALCGDLRFASQKSYFDFRQLQIGLASGYGGAKRLVESLGKSRASYILLTSQRVTMQDAYDWGLIHGIAQTSEDLDALVESHAAKICTLEPLSVAAQKKMLSYASHFLAQPALETKLFEKIWKNATHLRTLEKFR